MMNEFSKLAKLADKLIEQNEKIENELNMLKADFKKLEKRFNQLKNDSAEKALSLCYFLNSEEGVNITVSDSSIKELLISNSTDQIKEESSRSNEAD
ncbi:hypothetical protein [Pseudobacillus wudalianchiensis]|uniref:Uncharacterized protein n=1 Tax=Pseudobacillus wudalianchiensis TaxID=1743143 RepID=A0A1B9B8A2_9BACI|nr:hypothetical protein [Bacillus wudalianchiensis]OCA92327.1 hypothetical protein A8F95_00985 [Bacillus wudalianchiensis]